jgi:hypothetical protein
MRFLRLFFTLFLSIVIVGGGSFLLLREGQLFWAQWQIHSDLKSLQRNNSWTPIGERCSQETASMPSHLQLRFLNDREYILEVGCEGSQTFSLAPKRKLPGMVKKTTGSAGFILPLNSREIQGEITLTLWKQNWLIQGNGETIISTWGETTVISDRLISSCQAHGLTCCDPVREIGEGQLFRQGVNDCQESCYPSCLRRPNLLFFQSDPPVDATTRITKVSRENTFMLFSYTFETDEADLSEVVLNFGDGTKQTSTLASDRITKEYNCPQGGCHYQVSIRATDTRGVESSQLNINEIEVIVE